MFKVFKLKLPSKLGRKIAPNKHAAKIAKIELESKGPCLVCSWRSALFLPLSTGAHTEHHRCSVCSNPHKATSTWQNTTWLNEPHLCFAGKREHHGSELRVSETTAFMYSIAWNHLKLKLSSTWVNQNYPKVEHLPKNYLRHKLTHFHQSVSHRSVFRLSPAGPHRYGGDQVSTCRPEPSCLGVSWWCSANMLENGLDVRLPLPMFIMGNGEGLQGVKPFGWSWWCSTVWFSISIF